MRICNQKAFVKLHVCVHKARHTCIIKAWLMCKISTNQHARTAFGFHSSHKGRHQESAQNEPNIGVVTSAVEHHFHSHARPQRTLQGYR
jgi:hypothetical protein